MKKKTFLAVLLALGLLFSACAAPTITVVTTSGSTLLSPDSDYDPFSESAPAAEPTPMEETDGAPSLEDDFYTHVNFEWMSSNTIPGDKSRYNAFFEIQDTIDETLRADIDAMVASEEAPDDPLMQNLVDYYRLAADYETRDEVGMDPLVQRLDKVEGYESLEDFSADAAQLMLDSYSMPFGFGAGIDPGDSTHYMLMASAPSLMLGSRVYYEDAKEVGELLRDAYRELAMTLFGLAGYDEEEAEAHWDNAMAFDATLVPLALTEVEAADSTVTYNPTDIDDFAALSETFDLADIVEELCGELPEQINVRNPRYFEALDEVVSEKSFEQFKSWLLVEEVTGYTDYLTEEARQADEIFEMTISGQAEMTAPDKAAYNLATGTFGELVGQYYGENYFGEAARDEVIEMVESFIDVYRERLSANDWLSDETIEKAITKLDAMTIHVGWPEKLPPVYEDIEIVPGEDGGTLFENTMEIVRVSLAYNFSLVGEEVDKDLWSGIVAHQVNAFYSPSNNSIYFPAAILSAPFYSTDQTDSANYGGIGVVMGHEITHAFDADGSLYDEKGNMVNWWTDEDREEFETRTGAMVELFDGLPIGDIKIDGELCKTENVADAGGISSALQITTELEDGDLEEFFENYARIWRGLETTEFINSRYLADVHAPGIYRVNIQLGNCEEFYEVYGIEKGDGMYIEPARRVSIW